MHERFSNIAPSRPMRSIFGVFSIALPAREDSSGRTPSPRKKTIFGFLPVLCSPWLSTRDVLVAPASAAADPAMKERREKGELEEDAMSDLLPSQKKELKCETQQ